MAPLGRSGSQLDEAVPPPAHAGQTNQSGVSCVHRVSVGGEYAPMVVARRLVFAGSVQGVGFRWTTAGIARRFQVTGFVRNLPTGDVELVAEGSRQEVDDFVGAVQDAMAENITNVRETAETPMGYGTFEIRR